MTQFPNAAKGLMWIFWGEIVGIVCGLLRLIPVLGVLGLAGQVVSCALILLGAYRAGRDDDRFRLVMILTVVSLVLGLVRGDGPLASLAGLADNLIGMAVVYLVCTAAAQLLERAGCAELAARGVGIWKVYLGCMVVLLIFLGLVMIVPLLAVLGGAVAVIGTVVVLVVMILYIAFLYQSGRALSQATGD